MIRGRLQIGDGEILDTYKGWGFIYMDADERTEAPIKTRETTSYAEEAGEHIDPRTVQDAFDYTVKFLIECPNCNLENANAKIAAFNKALYSASYNSDIRTYKEVTFYNDYNRVKIVGLPEPIAQPTDFFRRQDGSALDCAQVELKIRVSDPSKCDFNTSIQETETPDIPEDPDTTTDELGIKWYNTTIDLDNIDMGEWRVSKPLAINQDLAEFTRVVNGEKIYYYNRENAFKILNQIASHYGVALEYYSDPIYFMVAVGLIQIDPKEYRTVWQPILINGDYFERGDVIATYPEMGYYKDGEWVADDVVSVISEDPEGKIALFIVNIQALVNDEDDPTITSNNIAVPLKIMIPISPDTIPGLSNVATTMSLRKIAKAND